MEKLDLFSSVIYKTKIDPTSYNKAELINTVKENYKRNPARNEWDTESYIHHAYEDWDNSDFLPLNLDPLKSIYSGMVQKLMDTIPFNGPVSYNWIVANVTACKDDQFMRRHNHEDVFYAGVHYVNLKDYHNRTTFFNGNHITDFMIDHQNSVSNSHLETSIYYPEFTLNVEEDDMIWFPGHLEHGITKNTETADLRITSVVNIWIKRSVSSSGKTTDS